MAFKLIVLSAILAYANAGGLIGAPAIASYAAPALSYGAAPLLGSTYHGSLAAPTLAYGGVAAPALAYGGVATPAITSQSSNILRSFGNLGQVSTYSKTIDTPFSSVRKADIRVSNPGLRIAAAAPALAYSAAPAISTYHGGLASPVLAGAPLLRSAAIAAPAITSYHGGLASPVLGAPVLRSAAIASPALGYAAGAPLLRSAAIAHPAALGVAYSAAPAVSHIQYASAYANYGW